MSDDIVIRAEGVGKQYRIGSAREPYGTFRDAASRLARRTWSRISGNEKIRTEPTAIWALKDVGFEVKRGEVLGVIGRNGAGKSTLLKILSRITPPTEGRIDIRGRVGSLLEVGTGFHPELTGRENIFLNGAILGMTRAEIKRKFDEIVEFAEIEKFLDTPVKRYSSGMYVRLAFAVAAHLEPEILLVDEVLAVGDAQFQKKCLGKMGDVAKTGRTVLFVSHNMTAIQGLCSRVIQINQGLIVADGSAGLVTQQYISFSENHSTAPQNSLENHERRRRGSQVILRKARLFAQETASSTVFMGGSLKIEVDFESECPIHHMRFGVAVENYFGQRLINFSPTHQAPGLITEPIQKGTIVCLVPQIRLLPNIYYLTFILGSGSEDLDRIDQAVAFWVESADVFQTGYAPDQGHGVFYQEAGWKIFRG